MSYSRVITAVTLLLLVGCVNTGFGADSRQTSDGAEADCDDPQSRPRRRGRSEGGQLLGRPAQRRGRHPATGGVPQRVT